MPWWPKDLKVGCSKFVQTSLPGRKVKWWSTATDDYNADVNSQSIVKDCKTRRVQLQLKLILAYNMFSHVLVVQYFGKVPNLYLTKAIWNKIIATFKNIQNWQASTKWTKIFCIWLWYTYTKKSIKFSEL